LESCLLVIRGKHSYGSKSFELVLVCFGHQLTAVKIQQQFRQSKKGKSDQHTDI
jgi:hypothetical protein